MSIQVYRRATGSVALLLAPLAAMIAPTPALAGQITGAQHGLARVSLDSAIYVEHISKANGTLIRSLEPARRLSPGERVVTLVNWSRPAGAGGFTLVNALPAALTYQRSGRDDEEVSVDGGRNWGHLGSLRIAGRLATPADVTHLRWRVSSEEAQAGSGMIAYAGILR